MEHEGNASVWQDLKRFYAFLHPYRFRAVAAMHLTMFLGGFDATIAWILKPYMDDVIIAGKEAAEEAAELGMTVGPSDVGLGSILFPLFIIGFVLVQSLISYGSTYLMTWVGRRVGNDVKLALFDKLTHSDAAYFDHTTTGEIMVRYNTDAETATDDLLHDFRLFVTRFVSSIALICVLVYNSWILAVVAVGVLVLAGLPLSRVRKRLKRYIKDSVESGVQVNSDFSEAYSGNRVISSYGLHDYVRERMDRTLQQLFHLKIKVVQRTNWVSLVMHLATGVGIAATVWLQAYLIHTNRMTPGNLVSFMTALLMLYTPIKRLGSNFTTMQTSIMAIRRIITLLERTPAIESKPDARPFPGLRDAIRFTDVTFAYDKGKDVLRHLDLEITAGTSVAFVGNSGGGKSTLVNLLPRFYDTTGGAVTIDGVDVRDMDLEDLRRNISIVFQDNFLFGGTIRENIMLGRRDASDKDVESAIQAACLDGFVAELPDGLETQIGERGVMLSGGQRQRMAIARAFIKNAPIVILDEATSALDTKSEAVVQKAIENLMRNRTVLIIAHRLTTVINANRIVVLRDGEIVETGTHAELMAQEDGVYVSLYRMQAN